MTYISEPSGLFAGICLVLFLIFLAVMNMLGFNLGQSLTIYTFILIFVCTCLFILVSILLYSRIKSYVQYISKQENKKKALLTDLYSWLKTIMIFLIICFIFYILEKCTNSKIFFDYRVKSILA